MIKIQNISKSFLQGNNKIQILDNISLDIQEGQKVAIIGPSGSGKSTFLSVISGMDKPDKGKVFIDKKDITSLSELELCEIRNSKIGIIFQAFELINSFTAIENVMLPLDIAKKEAYNNAKNLLNDLGLGNRLEHLPKMLSGGEQQRVAIARAMINSPKVIFADEPTGNLDIDTGKKVIELLFNLIKKYNKTLVLITHDLNLASKMDRIFILKHGNLEEITHEQLHIQNI
ncbi:MAG: ABC transporter ATP-binding protein [Candidatus Sericytochromatia bacterium]